MGITEFEWEEITVQVRKSTAKQDNKVWLRADNAKKEDDRLNTIMIAGNLCEKAGWQNDIRVNLARQGNSLFRFKPSSTGLYRPKKVSKTSKLMCLKGLTLVAELRPHINGTEFDAWVENDIIYFKAKNE